MTMETNDYDIETLQILMSYHSELLELLLANLPAKDDAKVKEITSRAYKHITALDEQEKNER